MNKTLKQAITSKWLLVLNEYELIKQKRVKILKQLLNYAKPLRYIVRIYANIMNAGLKLGKIPRLYCLKREAQNLASLKC